MICLDPPAFAKNRGALAAARGGYKEINLRAMKLLAHEGILITSSCSYQLSEADFSFCSVRQQWMRIARSKCWNGDLRAQTTPLFWRCLKRTT